MKVRVLDNFPVDSEVSPVTDEEISLRGRVFDTIDVSTTRFHEFFPSSVVVIFGPNESHILYPEEYEVVR